MDKIITEEDIDQMIESLDEIHYDQLNLESLTEEEYQKMLDEKYADWEMEDLNDEVS